MVERECFRWALLVRDPDLGTFLVGKYYFPDATAEEPVIRTFRTREGARAAKRLQGRMLNMAVVKVRVSYEVVK